MKPRNPIEKGAVRTVGHELDDRLAAERQILTSRCSEDL